MISTHFSVFRRNTLRVVFNRENSYVPSERFVLTMLKKLLRKISRLYSAYIKTIN